MLGLAVAYSLVHGGARLLASATLGEDDALETLLVQDLRLGYRPPQPALYDWLLFGVQRVMGTGVAGFLLLKYGALVATVGFLYASARRILGSTVWALLAAESLALIYQISWRFHEGFTHQVLAMLAVAALLWGLLRVLDRRDGAAFALLGLIIGLGVMTTPIVPVAIGALLLAGALQPAIRRRMLVSRLALTALVALATASPYLVSLGAAPGPLTWIEPYAPQWLTALKRGLYDSLRGPFFYLSPLILILPLVFPGCLASAGRDILRAPNAGPEPDLAQLVLHGALFGLAACVIAAIVYRAGGYPMHALMPLYLTGVIWLMAVARRAAPAPAYTRRFAVLAAAIAALALGARLANMFILDPVCKQCRWGIPYAGLAAEMKHLGYQGGAILSPAVDLAGNLRVYFPAARIATLRWPIGIDHAAPQVETRALVWADEAPEVVGRTAKALESGPPLDLGQAVTVTIPWHHLWKPAGYRSSVWHVLVYEHRDPGKG